MITWLTRTIQGKRRIQPVEAGASMGIGMFTDWLKEVSRLRSCIEPLVPSDDEIFEVEAATLMCFVCAFTVSRKSGFVTSPQQMDTLNDGFYQTVAELLAQQGWTRVHFESWNRIREDRYNEYARLIEADKSPASPKLGFAYVRRVIPGVEKADLLEPGLKVGIWTGKLIVNVGQSLEAFQLELD